jgi:hypothetical protein
MFSSGTADSSPRPLKTMLTAMNEIHILKKFAEKLVIKKFRERFVGKNSEFVRIRVGPRQMIKNKTKIV